MKKLIFGLALSVGMSGMAMASNIEIVKTTDVKFEKADNADLLKPSGCSYINKYRILNCDGSTSYVNGASQEGPCGTNANGSVVMKIVRITAACDGGEVN